MSQIAAVSVALMGDETLDPCESILERHGGKLRWRSQILPHSDCYADFSTGGWDVSYFVPLARVEEACALLIDALGIVATIHRERRRG
jgi:hypothetical protein